MNKYEAEFSNIVRAYRKRHMGKGPSQVRTKFCKNWAICELEGNLSPIEKFIASAEDGKQMLRSARTEMVKEIYKKLSSGNGRTTWCKIHSCLCGY